MRTTFLLIGLLLFNLGVSQQYFFNSYVGNSSETATSMAHTKDGGFVLVGNSNSFRGSLKNDILIVKTDSFGTRKWSKILYGNNNDNPKKIIQASDSGFVIAGYTSSFSPSEGRAFVLKLNSSGELLWTRTVDSISGGFSDIIEESNGDIILVGWSNYRALMAKFSHKGSLLWKKTYGNYSTNDGDAFHSFVKSNNGSYVILGQTRTHGFGSASFYLVKVDQVGDTIWTKVIGGNGYEEPSKIINTPDGGFLLGGESTSFNPPLQVTKEDIFLVKVNSLGIVQWSKSYGGIDNDGCNSLLFVNGGYLIIGYSYSNCIGNRDIYLLMTNDIGDTQWIRTYGDAESDSPSEGMTTKDNGFIITGEISDTVTKENNMFLMKVDSLGEIPCFSNTSTSFVNQISPSTRGGRSNSTYIPSDHSSTFLSQNVATVDSVYCISTSTADVFSEQVRHFVRIFPNPVLNHLYIELSTENDYFVQLINMHGQVIKETTSSSSFDWDTGEIESGMYLIRACQGGECVKERIVKIE